MIKLEEGMLFWEAGRRAWRREQPPPDGQCLQVVVHPIATRPLTCRTSALLAEILFPPQYKVQNSGISANPWAP